MTNTQEALKKNFKEWMKSNKKSREWLAQQCGVEKNTVDGWFRSRRNIPEIAARYIKTLMEEDDLSSEEALSELNDLESRGKMFLYLPEDVQSLVFQEAARLNMDVSTYCTLAVEWCCAQTDIGDRIKKRLDERRNEAYAKAEESEEERERRVREEVVGQHLGELHDRGKSGSLFSSTILDTKNGI